jgi:very-short-patch-repair endonuclease
MRRSKLELLAMQKIREAKLPIPLIEFQFFPQRRWRADFAWLTHKVLLEVEGGIFIGGRHNRPLGFTKDCEKYNQANLDGWIVLRVTSKHISDGSMIAWLTAALDKRSNNVQV